MIPVGLLGYSQLNNQHTPGLLGQGYWLGNQYIFPRYEPAPPPTFNPMAPQATPAAVNPAETPPAAGRGLDGLLALGWGQGPQGEMGGFAGPVAPAPGLPGTATTPTGQPVAEPPAPAATGLPSLPAAEPPNTMTKDLISEVKEFVDKATPQAPSIGVASPPSTADDLSAQMSNDFNNAMGMASAMGLVDQFGDPVGMGGGNSAGPAEAGDHQGASNPGQAPGGIGGAGAEPYRRGGFVPKDLDRKLEPVRGMLHEGEFVINPEMTAVMKKHGLLHRLDKMQKRMVR